MITETAYTERVLIVLNPDGSLKGAQAEALREWRDGTALIGAKQETVPLTAEALVAAVPSAPLLVQIATLEARVQELEADVAARDASLAAMTAERNALAAAAVSE